MHTSVATVAQAALVVDWAKKRGVKQFAGKSMQDIQLKESKEHGDVYFPFAFYRVTNAHPRYVMETHWHEECEICRVLSGELHITIDGKSYVGRGHNGVGDIFFINPGSVHGAEPINCVYECIVFDMHFLLRERSLSNSFLYSLLYNQRKFVPQIHANGTPEGVDNSNSNSNSSSSSYSSSVSGDRHIERRINHGNPVEDANVRANVSNVVNILFETLHTQNAGYQLKTFGLMYYLLGLFEEHNLFVKPEVAGEAVNRIMKMRLALSYIHRNYKQSISLTELSELLDLKPPSVVKLFKDIINRRPMEYINNYRIQCAMEMLKDSKSSVTSVAYDCGFADVSYFSKVFKKYTGRTPSEYLKTLNKEMLINHA